MQKVAWSRSNTERKWIRNEKSQGVDKQEYSQLPLPMWSDHTARQTKLPSNVATKLLCMTRRPMYCRHKACKNYNQNHLKTVSQNIPQSSCHKMQRIIKCYHVMFFRSTETINFICFKAIGTINFKVIWSIINLHAYCSEKCPFKMSCSVTDWARHFERTFTEQ